MLLKVRHDLSEVGFVEVPGDDTCSVRVIIDVAAELVVEFGQSQAFQPLHHYAQEKRWVMTNLGSAHLELGLSRKPRSVCSI